jgi:hypothetical protein
MVEFVLDFVLQSLILFIGFAIGRIGDKFGGHLNAPHHWIYGLLAIITGLVFYYDFWGIALISFGVGHFVSDLDDFINFRVFGVDEPHEWKFWSVK